MTNQMVDIYKCLIFLTLKYVPFMISLDFFFIFIYILFVIMFFSRFPLLSQRLGHSSSKCFIFYFTNYYNLTMLQKAIKYYSLCTRQRYHVVIYHKENMILSTVLATLGVPGPLQYQKLRTTLVMFFFPCRTIIQVNIYLFQQLHLLTKEKLITFCQ